MIKNNLKDITFGIEKIKSFEIKLSVDILKIKNKEKIAYGYLKIKGIYEEESKGAKIGELLRGISIFVIEYHRLDLIIFDLTDLDYKYGNNLIGIIKPDVFEMVDKSGWLGYYILCSEKNIQNIKSLLSYFKEEHNAFVTKDILEIEDYIKNIIDE